MLLLLLVVLTCTATIWCAASTGENISIALQPEATGIFNVLTLLRMGILKYLRCHL